jgi:Lon protease-like protein
MIDLDQPVGLFPLASCPLLPAATIPLHVFEPRYRQLVGHALERDRPIAMAMIDADARDALDGLDGPDPRRPPLRSVVCLGRVLRHQRHDDGRYHILLQGLQRARIEEELSHATTMYRQAMLEPLTHDAPLEIDYEATRRKLDRLLADPVLDQLASFKPLREHLDDDLPTGVVIDLATLCTAASDDQRYRVLAEPDLRRRGDWLAGHLADLLVTLRTADRYRLPTADDGLPLN